MSVTIARGKIHLREGALCTESGIHKAAALENLRPIQCRYETHARDHVADGHVCPNLSLMFRSNHVVATSSRGRDLFVQPAKSRHDTWILVAQALEQSHDERRRQPH